MLAFMAGETLLSEAQKNMWDCTCRGIVEKHDEAGSNQLLKVLRKIVPSLSVWEDDDTDDTPLSKLVKK
jgi:hypothetical protein